MNLYPILHIIMFALIALSLLSFFSEINFFQNEFLYLKLLIYYYYYSGKN